MKNETELKIFGPLDIISLDKEIALGVFTHERIEAIQLDAFKAGAEWAAELVFNFPTQSLPQSAKMAEATKAILSASSNLKEIPKL